MPGSSSRSSRGSSSSPGRTAPARRTCSSRCTSARRASRPARAPTCSSSARAPTAGRVELTGRRGTVPVDGLRRPQRNGAEARPPRRRRAPLLRAAPQRARHPRLHPRPPGRRQGRPGRPARLHRPLARHGSTPRERTCRSTTPPPSGQRNAALRRVALGVSEREVLAPWTAQVADLGSMLDAARRDVIELLQPSFAERAGELGLDDVSLGYDAAPPDDHAARGAARPRPRAGHDRRRPAPGRDQRSRAATATCGRSARRASSGSPSSRSSSPRPS